MLGYKISNLKFSYRITKGNKVKNTHKIELFCGNYVVMLVEVILWASSLVDVYEVLSCHDVLIIFYTYILFDGSSQMGGG
jgi:hypothetical protein